MLTLDRLLRPWPSASRTRSVGSGRPGRDVELLCCGIRSKAVAGRPPAAVSQAGPDAARRGEPGPAQAAVEGVRRERPRTLLR